MYSYITIYDSDNPWNGYCCFYTVWYSLLLVYEFVWNNSTLATNTLLLKKQIITIANIHIFVISRYLYCVDKTVCILTIGLQIITTINCLKTIPSIGKAQNKINATHNVSTVLFPIFFTRQIYVFSIFQI